MEQKNFSIQQGNIYLEITSRCNLKCSYCYNDSNARGVDLDIEKIYEIMDYSISCGVNSIAISGGEPFLHNGIFDILHHAASVGMHIYLVTNGSLLSEDICHKILEYNNILKFQFSFDGANAETHGLTRGQNNFYNIINCITFLVHNGFDDSVYVRYNLMEYNYGKILEFVDLCGGIGVRNISFSEILDQGRASQNQVVSLINIKDKEIKSTVMRQIESARKKYPNIEIKYSPKVTVSCPYAINEKNKSIQFLPRIDSLGNVYLCQAEVNTNRIIGNIYDTSLADIVVSKELCELINYITDKSSRNKNCTTCAFKSICGGGCIAVTSPCEKIKTQLIHDFIYMEK